MVRVEIPRLIVSGLKGGSGKTIVSIAFTRYFNSLGLKVKPFKKGPDYIDAGWLSVASGHPATNLDPFFMDKKEILYLFKKKTEGYDISIIEGNRGLFDGKDIDGSCSTAQLADVIKAPVILVIDCTKMTRTVVPIIVGCAKFNPSVRIEGVIFNNTGGERHRRILRRCVEKYTDVKVIGALPRFSSSLIFERHMGLVSCKEVDSERMVDNLTKEVVSWLDMEVVKRIADKAEALNINYDFKDFWFEKEEDSKSVRIGIVKDASLWFYYPENLEALEKMGAELVEVSLLSDKEWPEIHGLYLGGGFPETMAEKLAENKKIKDHILKLSKMGMPIYAECGGLMYLCKNLIYKDKTYPMAGVFPITIELCKKPQGHGYTEIVINRENPFFDLNDSFTGHEFHYSRCVSDIDTSMLIFSMKRGVGIKDKRDGLLYKNTLGCYNHLHVFANPKWAKRFVQASKNYKDLLKNNK